MYNISYGNNISTISKTIVDTAKVVAKTIKDTSESVSKKIVDTASRISSTVKQVKTTAANLKKAYEDVKSSATSLVGTTVKTAVSVGADVTNIVAKVGIAVVGIKATWDNPASGIITKVSKTAGILKVGIDSIKEPIKRIPNTISTGYNDIKKDYNNIKDTAINGHKEISDIIQNNYENNPINNLEEFNEMTPKLA